MPSPGAAWTASRSAGQPRAGTIQPCVSGRTPYWIPFSDFSRARVASPGCLPENTASLPSCVSDSMNVMPAAVP